MALADISLRGAVMPQGLTIDEEAKMPMDHKKTQVAVAVADASASDTSPPPDIWSWRYWS